MKSIYSKKTFLILILIITMLAIQGCGGQRGMVPIFVGTEGIKIEFINNAPPTNMYEHQPINIMIELWNKGAYTPQPNEEIIVNLRYDPIYFDSENEQGSLITTDTTGRVTNLAGKSEIWPQGQRIIEPLKTLRTREILGTREMPTTNMEVTACYPYKTFLSESICLDTDIYQIESSPLCRNKGVFTYSSQGAPIAITKLEVDIIPVGYVDLSSIPGGTPTETSQGSIGYSSDYIGTLPTGHSPILNESGELVGVQQGQRNERLILVEPVIRIYARNVAQGDVFITNQKGITTSNLCSMNDDSFKYREHNKIKLTNATLDGFAMNCTKTEINLANPQDFVMCRLSENQTGYLRQNLEVQFLAEFSYHYRESAIKQVKILRE